MCVSERQMDGILIKMHILLRGLTVCYSSCDQQLKAGLEHTAGRSSHLLLVIKHRPVISNYDKICRVNFTPNLIFARGILTSVQPPSRATDVGPGDENISKPLGTVPKRTVFRSILTSDDMATIKDFICPEMGQCFISDCR